MIENMTKLANDLNSDLAKISTWSFKWNMDFNADPTK